MPLQPYKRIYVVLTPEQHAAVEKAFEKQKVRNKAKKMRQLIRNYYEAVMEEPFPPDAKKGWTRKKNLT